MSNVIVLVRSNFCLRHLTKLGFKGGARNRGNRLFLALASRQIVFGRRSDELTRRSTGRAVRAVLLLFTVTQANFARVPGAWPLQTSSTLTPLQRKIETEKSHLTSASLEERRDAVQRLDALARPESSRVASRALADPAPIVRATAARAMLWLPADEAVPLLLPLLRDKDEFVRRETAYALGLTRSRAAVSHLIDALEQDKSAAVRAAAAIALGQIGDRAAVAPLSRTLGRRIKSSGFLGRITRRTTEENEFVRRAAAVSLGQLGGREAVPTLIAVLADERAGDDVRREVARALGHLRDASAIPTLRAALTARDPYLAQISAEALRQIELGKAATTIN